MVSKSISSSLPKSFVLAYCQKNLLTWPKHNIDLVLTAAEVLFAWVFACESVWHAALSVACGNGEWHDPKTEKGKRKRKMKMKSRQSKVNATTASHRRNQLALCDDVDVEVGSDSDSDRDGDCDADVDVAATCGGCVMAPSRPSSGNWLAISFAATFRLQRNLPNMLQ